MPDNPLRSAPNSWVARALPWAGASVALLGILVDVGWYAHWSPMIRVMPGLAPMKFNTALCFVLCGTGLSLMTTAHKLPALAFAGVATAIVVITLVEYGIGRSVGIDQLLILDYLAPANAFAGRMSPQTAIAFVFVGSGLLLSGMGHLHPWRLGVTGLMACLVCVIAVMAFGGYLLGVETAIGWGAYTRTALHTAVGLLVLGLSLFAWVWQLSQRQQSNLARWLPLAGPLTLMFTVVLLSALSLVQLHSSYNSRKAAYDTLMSAQALLGAVTDTQRGMRGYVLTGQPEALEAYHRGLEAAPKTLAELTALTRDNAAQQQLASPLVGDLGRMIDYSHRLLAARDSFGLQAAVELESTGEGRAVLNRFRADLQQLNDTIHRLLLDRDARTEENFRNTTFLLILAMVVAVILLARAQIAAIRAIALRRRTEASLAEEQERLKITLSSIGDAVITTDADTCITYINATGETLLGQTLKDLKSRRLDEVMTLTQPNTSKAAPNLLGQSILHVKAFRRETACVLHRPDGVACYVRDLVSPVLDSQGFITGVVVVLQDAGADVERAQDLNHRASHDVLTGLANRSEFHRRLKVVFDRATQLDLPAALLAIDLDRFKAVNDTGGHAAGDAVLRRVAEVLRGTVRHSDIVARLGGDEFAVIFPNCPPARSSILAQKILQALNPLETDWEESSYSVGASIGLAVISAHFKEPAEWLAAADRACYQAKNEGRGQLSSAQSMPAED